MKIRKCLIFLLVLTLFGCNSIIGERGNGNIVTESRKVDSYEIVNVSGNFDVILEPGATSAVSITGDENLLDFIEVYTRHGELYLRSERHLFSKNGIKIIVPFEELSEINSSGASTLKTEGTIESDALEITLSGAGKIDFEINCNSLKLVLSGAGIVYLSGTAEKVEAKMSGAGALEAFSLNIQECDIGISGIGNASVNVAGSLHVQISGLGGVSYIGDVEKVTSDISGVGKVSRDHE